MFRGEPTAYWTVNLGFAFFLITQLYGIANARLIVLPGNTIAIHYYLAFFGWIGFLIMGAQLQFFRAMASVRKYEPTFLRFLFLFTLLIGIGILIMVESLELRFYSFIGLLVYFLGVIIHFYWLYHYQPKKYFKLPLDHFFVAQAFFLSGVIILLLKSLEIRPFVFVERNIVTHIFVFGWITITLEGALIRILPMFVGKRIAPSQKKRLNYHLSFRILSSLLVILSFSSTFQFLTAITSLIWFGIWLWTLYILAKSILTTKGTLQHYVSLLFFLPGLFWFTFGMVVGIFLVIIPNISFYLVIRRLHIHFSLLAGLSLIMLGAYHRINAFQTFTLLYTGKTTDRTELILLREKRMSFTAIGLNLGVLVVLIGFIIDDFTLVGFGGLITFIFTLVFGTSIGQNILEYLKNKKDALPYYLKPSEATKPRTR